LPDGDPGHWNGTRHSKYYFRERSGRSAGSGGEGEDLGMTGPGEPAELIEAYFERGWTDGLPVVPPTGKSVAEMLAGGALRGDQVIGEVPGRNSVVVAEKVAINAGMAGCRPEYMPVVAAAIRALCHPDFAYHGPASSTGGSAIVLIVNGPIARRIGLNAGNNALGQDWRANATIGRAVRLTMMNVMQTRPGLLDRVTPPRPPDPPTPSVSFDDERQEMNARFQPELLFMDMLVIMLRD
jgi:hypothetical protein